jgi:nucleotide-binding universal stress UspA family protein
MARGFLLARQLEAELRIMHIVDDQLPAELKAHSVDWARRTLAREAGRLAQEDGRRPSIEVFEGDPVKVIVRAADPNSTDLLVLGVHGRSDTLAKPFPQTTAGRALSSSFTAALLVSQDAVEPYRYAVVGVDFSIFSRAAVRQTMQVAPTAHLHLVHAFHAPFKGRPGTEGFADSLAYQQRLQLDAFLKEEMNELERRAGALAPNPVKIDKSIEEGRPDQVLRAAVRSMNADLITIATHGKGVISRAIWGGVAMEMLRDPPCDVLVVRPF